MLGLDPNFGRAQDGGLRRMKPILWLAPSGLAAAFLALVVCSPAAWACSCALESEEEMVERADFAVVASPIAGAYFDVLLGEQRTPLPPPRAVTVFQVVRVLKGPPMFERISAVHEIDPAACGLGFAPERRYLLAFSVEDVHELAPLRIGLCSVVPLGSLERADVE